MGIILFSIPFFFLLIGVELAYAAWSRKRLFRLNDSLADLACGILSQLSGVFTRLFSIGIYAWVGAHAAVQRWAPGVPAWPARAPFAASAAFPGFGVDAGALAAWTAAFLLVDLAYYWSHRLSHEVNLLWAGHVVHHSSEEYNLAVALRQSSLHGLFTWVFYLPLALMGIPWQVYAACYSLNLLYQFWIHTRAVGRLGAAAEWVLNTPSHHRVHHGRNPKYLDRNHAGVLIVWDRLFGTFQREEEEPVYGITKPLRSWNPLWANVHAFADLARDALRAGAWRDRWMLVFGPPGWRPIGRWARGAAGGERGDGGGVRPRDPARARGLRLRALRGGAGGDRRGVRGGALGRAARGRAGVGARGGVRGARVGRRDPGLRGRGGGGVLPRIPRLAAPQPRRAHRGRDRAADVAGHHAETQRTRRPDAVLRALCVSA